MPFHTLTHLIFSINPTRWVLLLSSYHKAAEAQRSWMAQRLSMVLQVGSQDKNSSRLAAETTLLTALLGNLFQRPEALQIMWWLLCRKITLFLIFELLGFPHGTSGKEPTYQCRRHKRNGFKPWIRKIAWRRAWQPLQYFCLENPMDRGAWRLTVYGVTKSRTQLKWLSMHAHWFTDWQHFD